MARFSGRAVLGVAFGAAALVFLADLFRWMVVGPIELRLIGKPLPAENRPEAVALLATLLGLGALAAAGGLRRRRGPTLLAGGLALAVCLANLRPTPSGDTAPATLLPFALVRNGQLTFEGTGLASPVLPIESDPPPYFLVRHGPRVASKYSPAVGLLATPVLLPAALGRFDARTAGVLELGKMAAAVLTALGAACLFAAAARLAGRTAAGWATALYVLGTPVLSVLGQSLWLHTGAALGLSLALLALARAEDDPPWRTGLLVGAGLGLTVACRPVDVVLSMGVAVALFQVRRRTMGWMLATSSGPVLLLLLYQWRIFGSPLTTGYGSEASMGWTTPLAEGIPGLLVSPGRGLFLESPVLLLGLVGLLRAGRGSSARWFLPLAVAFAAFVVLMGRWWVWWGGFSPGNRMLSDGLPFLGLGLACALRDLWPKRSLRAPVVLLAVVSVATFGLFTFHALDDPFRSRTMALSDGAAPWEWKSHPLVAVAQELLTPGRARVPR